MAHQRLLHHKKYLHSPTRLRFIVLSINIAMQRVLVLVECLSNVVMKLLRSDSFLGSKQLEIVQDLLPNFKEDEASLTYLQNPSLVPVVIQVIESASSHRKNSRSFSILFFRLSWVGQFSRYSDWLRAGRLGDRIPVGSRFSAPVQTGPGAHPASCTMGTGSFPGVKSGRGVTLTPHPLLVPWS